MNCNHLQQTNKTRNQNTNKQKNPSPKNTFKNVGQAYSFCWITRKCVCVCVQCIYASSFARNEMANVDNNSGQFCHIRAFGISLHGKLVRFLLLFLLLDVLRARHSVAIEVHFQIILITLLRNENQLSEMSYSDVNKFDGLQQGLNIESIVSYLNAILQLAQPNTLTVQSACFC